MLNKLRGMYAFAIWDRNRQGVFLARDPFGIKPLYYSDNGHTFRLASQVKPLRDSGKIDLTPDPAGHVGYFLWGHVPDPYTMFRNIRSLPAGHTLWVDRNGARAPKSYCNISEILREGEECERQNVQSNPQSAIRDPQFRAERLRSALAETIRYHLVADVPVGVFLSSGLDSTTIAALAAEQGGILRTVTLGFQEYKGTAADETPLAEQFAKRCGATHQTIWVSRADFEAERDHVFAAMDRPTTDGVNTFFVSLAAKQANLKVALSGVGGDELFASYPSFVDIPRMVRLFKPLSPLLPTFGREFRIISAPIVKRLTSPKYAGMFEYGGTYSGAYLLRRGMFMPWELPELLDPEMVRAGWQELQTLLRLDETLDGIRNPRLKVSALEMSWYMRNQLLRDSDWAGMGHSVEIRVPFVDVDLLKAIAPLLSGKYPPTKRDMAASVSGLITPEILDRPKTGFQIPVREWLLAENPKSEIHNPPSAVSAAGPNTSIDVFPESQLRQRLPARRRSDARRVDTLIPHDTIKQNPKRILVFRIGQLGDTIVALPAMWLVRKSYPAAYMALLCDRHPGKTHVIASDLLRGSHIFDEYLSYPVSESGEFMRRGRMAGLLTAIRSRRFDTLIYLAPTNRTPDQIARDRRFFSIAGIRNFVGMHGFEHFQPRQDGQPMPMAPRESDLLLRRLAASGLVVRPEDESRMDLGLGPDDDAPVMAWLEKLPPDQGRRWIAVGPGSKMPAKRWPLLRFQELCAKLISEFDVWPVVFGGEEDKVIGSWLLEKWGRGYNAAGALGLRPALAAIKRCQLFVGNDTGTMHMAAAVGVPCVAIFSSRERPGLWYPHGEGHRVFRSQIECEGCGLVECLERGNECLKRISAVAVLEACRELLATRSATPKLAASGN